LPAGTYSGLLQIAEQANGVTTQQVVGLTLVVRAPGATSGTIGLDQVMAASYPQSDGTLTPAVFTVSNQDASPQTYTVAVDPATGSASDAVTQPAQFTLTPGHSQAVQVQATSAKSLTFAIAAQSGAVVQVSAVALGANAAEGACTPTQLLPVVNQIDSGVR
jgi:P pilus assembly chaperone PapD